MASHRQIPLTPWQVCQLDNWRGKVFRRVFRLAETRLGARASGDTLEAIASGCSRLLTCRKAGRLVGMTRASARGLRPYNLKNYFNGL